MSTHGMDTQGYRVIEVQPTPNPNAMKFILDRPISDRPMSFLTPESGAGHELARQLFATEGVTSLLFLSDFVTVNKSPATKWTDLTAKVKKVLSTAPH